MPKVHEVVQGECLASIAHQYGLVDWRVLYHLADNEMLRKERPNPHVLMPGDKVVIPDLAEKQFLGQTDKRHTFTVVQRKVLLRLTILEAVGDPGTRAPYELAVEGLRKPLTGELSDKGELEVEIPADAKRAMLKVFTPDGKSLVDVVELLVGSLDPITEPSGIQERLRRLGFDCGNDNGRWGPHSLAALLCFQEEYGLDEKGEPGPMTRAKLLELVGI